MLSCGLKPNHGLLTYTQENVYQHFIPDQGLIHITSETIKELEQLNKRETVLNLGMKMLLMTPGHQVCGCVGGGRGTYIISLMCFSDISE